jgi:hypothetical protein
MMTGYSSTQYRIDIHIIWNYAALMLKMALMIQAKITASVLRIPL